jgi:hypothetical protein
MVKIGTAAILAGEINRNIEGYNITPEQTIKSLVSSWKKNEFLRELKSLNPFFLPIIGDWKMLEQNQDREMLDTFQKILDFVKGDIPSIPGNWSTEIISILLQNLQ